MKAAICVHCSDVVTPHRDWQNNRAWRWCECAHAAVRWKDGAQGLLEVTAVHGSEYVRVIGLNNSFLVEAVADAPTHGGPPAHQWWRKLHENCSQGVDDGYLFHASKRDCWALVVAVGESGDVTYVPNVVPPMTAEAPA